MDRDEALSQIKPGASAVGLKTAGLLELYLLKTHDVALVVCATDNIATGRNRHVRRAIQYLYPNDEPQQNTNQSIAIALGDANHYTRFISRAMKYTSAPAPINSASTHDTSDVSANADARPIYTRPSYDRSNKYLPLTTAFDKVVSAQDIREKREHHFSYARAYSALLGIKQHIADTELTGPKSYYQQLFQEELAKLNPDTPASWIGASANWTKDTIIEYLCIDFITDNPGENIIDLGVHNHDNSEVFTIDILRRAQIKARHEETLDAAAQAAAAREAILQAKQDAVTKKEALQTAQAAARTEAAEKARTEAAERVRAEAQAKARAEAEAKTRTEATALPPATTNPKTPATLRHETMPPSLQQTTQPKNAWHVVRGWMTKIVKFILTIFTGNRNNVSNTPSQSLLQSLTKKHTDTPPPPQLESIAKKVLNPSPSTIITEPSLRPIIEEPKDKIESRPST